MSSRNIRKNLLFQIICWIAAANLYMVARIVGLEDYDRIQFLEPMRYNVAFTQATLGGLFVGILLGIIDIFLANSPMRKKSFSFLVLVKGLIYIASIIIIITAIRITTDLTIDNMTVRQTVSDLFLFFQGGFIISLLICALFVSFFVNFIKQVSQKFGPGILIPMFLGKYHKPKQADRIFMFLDLRDSTAHAEQIGHVKYSEMIQDCFYDLATQIEKYHAEIYQYVGDEVVLTWKTKTGLQNQNCLHAFFAFDEYLQSRATYYFNKYSVQPEFKAGTNCGQVMVAEVGEIKKEIAYHGDVLNTAARIQSKCNEFGKNFLISQNLKQLLEKSNGFIFREMGSTPLKGRLAPVMIYSVEKG